MASALSAPIRLASVAAEESGPDPATMAAIVAAVELAWPRAVVVAAGAEGADPPRWRFSGRWWSRPVAARRNRPW